MRISIGDVGYVRHGAFHLLFSAGRPLGERQLGIDVPDTFEELTVGSVLPRQARPPGYLHTDTVREIETGPGAKMSTTPYALSLRPSSTYFKMCYPGS